MDKLDIIIMQLEDTQVDCVVFQNGELTAWLKELRDSRELIRRQTAVIESQSRYIEEHINRRSD